MEFDIFTMNNCTKIFLEYVLSLQLYVQRFREYFWGNSFHFPWKNDSGGVPKKKKKCGSPLLPVTCIFPLTFSHFPEERQSILASPWQAWLVGRYFYKSRFPGPVPAYHIQSHAGRPQNLPFHKKFFWGDLTSPSFENHFSSSIVVGFYYVR